VVIHHIEMDKVGAGCLHLTNLFAESGKISRQDAWGNPISRGGCHGSDSRSALTPHGPPDNKKQEGQRNPGLEKDEPHTFDV
jgi:hypothetical protein